MAVAVGLVTSPAVLQRRPGLPPGSSRSSTASGRLALCCCAALAASLLGIVAQRPTAATPASFLAAGATQTVPAGGAGQPQPLLAHQGRQPAVATAAADPSDCSGVRGEALSGVLLPPMDPDEPAWLSFVISRYLDEEWVEQPVHSEIGETVGRLYEESRTNGDDDLIAVLAALSYGLKDMWSTAGFGEAFEGPVDVANRAAEFLMLRLGREVWSYGQSNSDVQKKMLQRVDEYEKAHRALRDAVQAE